MALWLHYGAFRVESCLALCPVFFFFFFFFFSVLFSIAITSLGEEGAGVCASRAFVCLFCTRQFLSIFSSSRCQRLAAACDCSTLWTFLLTPLYIVLHVS